MISSCFFRKIITGNIKDIIRACIHFLWTLGADKVRARCHYFMEREQLKYSSSTISTLDKVILAPLYTLDKRYHLTF